MNLIAPRLFQCCNGILDLQCLNPPNSGGFGDEGDPVVVSVLLPSVAKAQENLTVYFGSSVSKTFTIGNPELIVMDCPFNRSELPVCGETYDVYFEYAKSTSAVVSVSLVDSMDSFVPRYIYSADGFYAQGVIDVWVVPSFRLLLKNDPVIRPVEKLGEDVALTLAYVTAAGIGPSEIGAISYDAAKAQWDVELNQDSVTLQKGDLIVMQNANASGQELSFSMLL